MPVSELEYPFPDAPAPAQWLTVAPGVLWLRMPLPFALDHINLWLIEDGAGYALIDTGIGLAETRALWEEVLSTLPPPPTQTASAAPSASGATLTRLIATHAHPDHLGNAHWLTTRCAIPLYMSQGEYFWACAVHGEHAGFGTEAILDFFKRHGLDAEGETALRARGNQYARGVPQLPRSFIRLREGDTLQIGAHAWRVIDGYGHSAEHLALYCATLGVLIAGDMLLPRISTHISTPAITPDDDPLARFSATLARFAALPAATLVLPSHGLPFVGAAQRVAALELHHAERCATLLSALESPRSAAELLPTLFPRRLDAHQLMFAMGEAIGHLNHLLARGLVSRVEGRDGILRFSQTTVQEPARHAQEE